MSIGIEFPVRKARPNWVHNERVGWLEVRAFVDEGFDGRSLQRGWILDSGA
jgi:hypothetical protein